MINQKVISNNKYYKSRTVEKFASKKTFVDKFLDYMPFFIRIPLEFYYKIFKKGMKNPIYLALLFGWFVFMKKTVRINLEDTYRYKY